METKYFLGCSSVYFNHRRNIFYPKELPEIKCLLRFTFGFTAGTVGTSTITLMKNSAWAEKIKQQNARKAFYYFNNNVNVNATKNCLTLKKTVGRMKKGTFMVPTKLPKELPKSFAFLL